MDRLKYLKKVMKELGESAKGSKLVQALKNDLPVDTESRMARAAELFPLEGFHSTPKAAKDVKDKLTGEVLESRRDFNSLSPGLDNLVHIGVTPEQAVSRLEALSSVDNPGARTFKARFRANKPIRLEDPGSFDVEGIVPQLKQQGILSEEEIASIANKDNVSGMRALKNLLNSKGYDSFVYKNTFELPKDKLRKLDALRLEKDTIAFDRKLAQSEGILPQVQDDLDARERELSEQIKNFVEEHADDSYAVFDSSQVRSPTAMFNPAAVNEKNLLAGGVGALIGAGASNEAKAQEKPKSTSRFKLLKKSMKPVMSTYTDPQQSDEYSDFLEKISQLESSGGINTQHKVMQKGIHKDFRAIGKYGLMPKTVADVAYKLKNPESDLRKILGREYKDPEVEALAQVPLIQQEEMLNANPALQDKVARYLAADLAYKHDDDPEKMAYAWNQGSQIKTSDITPDRLDSNDYVNKYRRLKKKQDPDVIVLDDE